MNDHATREDPVLWVVVVFGSHSLVQSGYTGAHDYHANDTLPVCK